MTTPRPKTHLNGIELHQITSQCVDFSVQPAQELGVAQKSSIPLTSWHRAAACFQCTPPEVSSPPSPSPSLTLCLSSSSPSLPPFLPLPPLSLYLFLSSSQSSLFLSSPLFLSSLSVSLYPFLPLTISRSSSSPLLLSLSLSLHPFLFVARASLSRG